MEQMIEQCTNMMRMMGGMGGMGGMMGSGMMGPMLLWLFSIGGALLAGSVALLVWLTGRSRRGATGTPLTILQERFARGELGIEEYQERHSILRNQGEL